MIVGHDRVSVFSLLPPNADPHTFQPGARDVTRIADADLVLSVGLGLEEGWLKGAPDQHRNRSVVHRRAG